MNPFINRTILGRVVLVCGLSLLLDPTSNVWGNPTGGVVAAGSASITSAGTTETINQATQAAIINWQTFSINGGELTKFIVPTSSSATLNRVLGGNPSAIYGTLESNGKLFLINPNGIVVGPNGRIDTASFLGSTLNVSDADFLKGGDMSFSGTGGTIDNEGTIHASSGDVYLIANQVTNNGKLTAPYGNVGLGAGTDILFQEAGDQHIFVQANNSSTPRATGVTNAGTIRAATAELKAAGGNAYALAINNTGLIAANGYKKINGQVYLTSDGGDITNAGQISAQDSNGDGGTIVLNGHGTTSRGMVLNSGKLVASGKTKGAKGGTVEVLGNQVGITGFGLVDVSGDAGGGTALIGGDEHGTNPVIPDADQTYLGPDATITADALTLGDGGKVVLWGDQTTQAYGAISARGGAQGGNGGFVETSAPTLDVQTVPDVSAPQGGGGTWLLDPSSIYISDQLTTTPGFSAPFTITTGGVYYLNQGDLLSALLLGSVTLDAGTGSQGGAGTINWSSSTAFDIDPTAERTLTLNAPTLVDIQGVTINASGSFGLNLILNSSLTGAGAVEIDNSTLNLHGGSFTANGNGYTSSSDEAGSITSVQIYNSKINAQGGDINISGYAGYGNGDALDVGNGVYVGSDTENTSAITTTGTGNITINAYADQDVTSQDGIFAFDLYGSGNTISVGNGALSITGEVLQGEADGTGSGGSLTGIDIGGGATVEALGASGSISLTGSVSASSPPVVTDDFNSDFVADVQSIVTPTNADQMSGIHLHQGSFVTAADGGSISLTGTVAAGTATESGGIIIGGGSQVRSEGTTGAVTLLGTSLDSTALSLSVGVGISGDGTLVESAGGTGLKITGTAGALTGTTGTGLSEQGNGGPFIDPITVGVGVIDGAEAESDHSSALTLIGTGGADSSTDAQAASYGISIFSPVAETTTTVSSGGLLTMTGTAGSSPSAGIGIGLGGPDNVGLVSILSGGAANLTGTGGSGNTADSVLPNAGIYQGGNVTVDASGGGLTYTGTSGGGTTSTGLTFLGTDSYAETSGALDLVSLAGQVNYAIAGSATGTSVTSPLGTSSSIGNAPGPLTLNGGDFVVVNTAGQTLTSAMVSDLVIDADGNIVLGPVTTTDLSLDTTGNITQTGALDVYLLGIPNADAVTLDNTGNNISFLGNITHSGALNIYTDPGLTISGLISGAAPVLIEDIGGNLIFGPGGEITDSGAGNDINLVTNDAFINDSTLGADAIQVSGDHFFIYAGDPSDTDLGGLPTDFVQYGTTYPGSGLPSGDGIIFSTGSDTYAYTPEFSDFLPAALTPLDSTIDPKDFDLVENNGDEPFSYTAGYFSPTGSEAGGLADSSGNGGQIHSGDAAELGSGQLKSVGSQVASGALNQALSVAVHDALMDAMKSFGGFVDNDSGSSSNVVDSSDKSGEKIVESGGVVEIGGGGVKKIALNDAPRPLQIALGDDGFGSLPTGMDY